MSDRHNKLKIVKSCGRQAHRAAIRKKIVAGRHIEWQIVKKNSCRQHNELQIVIKQWQTAKRS